MTAERYTTKIVLVLLLNMLIFSIGCAIHADLIETFHFSGKIIGADNDVPIEGVEMLFIDKGYDSKRSENPMKNMLRIGESDKNGSFDFDFGYWWGYERAFYKSEPKKTFGIMFRQRGLKEKIVLFEANKLLQKENIVEVKIGVVSMEKE